MPKRKHQVAIRDDRAALAPGSLWWAYCRVSPGDKQDLASQRRAVQEFADKHGVVISRWWQDDGISGSSTAGREDFDDMIEASRQTKDVAGVLAWNLARWARNDLESPYYRADLRMRGYAVVSVADNIPGGDMAMLVEAFVDWKNRKFLEDLSKDTRRGLRDVVLKEVEVDGQKRTGFSGGGFPPRGYKARYVETGQRKNGAPRLNALWEIDPLWRTRVASARQMFASGELTTKIHTECALFKSLACYLTFWVNECYAGIRFCGAVRVEDAHPAYDSPEQWAAIQARLAAARNRRNARPAERRKYMLSGLLICGYCGAPLHGHHHNEGDFYYCANSRYRRREIACDARRVLCRDIEGAVVTGLQQQVLTPEALRQMVRQINDYRNRPDDAAKQERQHLEREVKRLNKEIAHLVDYIAQGRDSSAIASALAQKEKQLGETTANLRLAEIRERQMAPIALTEARLAAVAGEMRRDLENSRREMLAPIIRMFVDRVTVWDDKVELLPLAPVALVGQDQRLTRYPQRSTVSTVGFAPYLLALEGRYRIRKQSWATV